MDLNNARLFWCRILSGSHSPPQVDVSYARTNAIMRDQSANPGKDVYRFTTNLSSKYPLVGGNPNVSLVEPMPDVQSAWEAGQDIVALVSRMDGYTEVGQYIRRNDGRTPDILLGRERIRLRSVQVTKGPGPTELLEIFIMCNVSPAYVDSSV